MGVQNCIDSFIIYNIITTQLYREATQSNKGSTGVREADSFTRWSSTISLSCNRSSRSSMTPPPPNLCGRQRSVVPDAVAVVVVPTDNWSEDNCSSSRNSNGPPTPSLIRKNADAHPARCIKTAATTTEPVADDQSHSQYSSHRSRRSRRGHDTKNNIILL